MSTPTQAPELSAAVSAEIRALMARRMMTQADLAERLGVSEMWVSRKVRARQVIDLNDLQRIAAALDVTVVDLLPRDVAGNTLRYRARDDRVTRPASRTDSRRPSMSRPRMIPRPLAATA